MRADRLLVACGQAATRAQAQRLIAAGVAWRAPGDARWQTVAKCGQALAPGAQLRLLDAGELRYCSRGGLKLEAALAATGVRAAQRRCLDLGQSSGGFSDCLLQHGAAQVVGVDVGHGQLHARLRADARVLCIEGVNARALTPALLQRACAQALSARAALQPGPAPAPASTPAGDSTAVFDLLTADLSFISLTLVLPALAPLLAAACDALLLVKPQFELQPGQIGKGGIVRDTALYAQVERRLRACCERLGLEVRAWFASAITGGDGNREFFLHARSTAA